MSSATICIVLYGSTIAQILIILNLETTNRLKYKDIDKQHKFWIWLCMHDHRKYFMINLHEKNVADLAGGQTHNLLITSWTRIQLSHQRYIFIKKTKKKTHPPKY